MPELDARLERIEQAMYSLTGVTGELARETRSLVQGLASDRTAFRETLRELNGFVATAGLAVERLERQVGRLAETTEVGFTRLQLALEATTRETQRLIEATSRETQRLIAENNRLIAENNDAIRRLLDILRRGRENGEGPPA